MPSERAAAAAVDWGMGDRLHPPGRATLVVLLCFWAAAALNVATGNTPAGVAFALLPLLVYLVFLAIGFPAWWEQ